MTRSPVPPDARLALARARIAGNATVLEALEDRVEALAAAGDVHTAVAVAQIAGEFAYRNHAGVFASPRLERVLADLGRAHVPAPDAAPPARPGEVVHVLSEAYDTGGHSRLAWRWIARDAGRRSSVALTRQHAPVPPALSAAVEGRVLRIDAAGGLLARARALREAVAGAEAVVLHVHMYDVVPLLAFADPAHRPPVVFLDHADHLFWLGTGVADAVTSCRPLAEDLQVRRRGIARERSTPVPVPVDAPVRRHERPAAKQLLGLDADCTLVLTVATAHKYMAVTRPTFHDAAAAMLERSPGLVLLAVGSVAHGAWAKLMERFPGRVLPVGRHSDLAPFLDAADLYLDSYPFSSNTSVIEAAAHGLPIISFSPDPAHQGILLTNDPAIEHRIVREADPAALAEAVAALAGDPQRRAALGAEVRDLTLTVHDGPAWVACIEEAYRIARELGPTPGAAPVSAPVEDFEAIHHVLFEDTGVASGLGPAVAAQADVLPPPLRPRDAAGAEALAARLTAPAETGRVAIGRADAADADVAGLVERLRTTVREGVAARAVVVAAPETVGGLVPALESALAAGEDFDLDLVTGGALGDVAPDGALWVVRAGGPDAAAAIDHGAETLVY